MAFPTSPIEGQIYKNYKYNANKWSVITVAKTAKFKLSTNYSHLGGQWYVIPCNITVFNNIGGTMSSGRITPGITGYYRVNIGGYSTTGATIFGQRYAIGVYINGQNKGFSGGSYCDSSADSPLSGHSGIVYLDSDDYIEAAIYSVIPAVFIGQNTSNYHDFFFDLEYIGQ